MEYHLKITVSEKDGSNERSYTTTRVLLKEENEKGGFSLINSLHDSASLSIDAIAQKIIKDSKKAIEHFTKNSLISESTTPAKPLTEAQL